MSVDNGRHDNEIIGVARKLASSLARQGYSRQVVGQCVIELPAKVFDSMVVPDVRGGGQARIADVKIRRLHGE